MKTADDSVGNLGNLDMRLLFESLTVLWRGAVSGEHSASESYFCYCL